MCYLCDGVCCIYDVCMNFCWCLCRCVCVLLCLRLFLPGPFLLLVLCVFVCACVRTVCVFRCGGVCRTHTHIHARTHMHNPKKFYAHTHLDKHLDTRMYISYMHGYVHSWQLRRQVSRPHKERIHSHTRPHKHIHTHTHRHSDTDITPPPHTHTHTRTHKHIHANTHAQTPTYTHSFAHKHTHIRSHSRKHLLTHTHTLCMRMRMRSYRLALMMLSSRGACGVVNVFRGFGPAIVSSFVGSCLNVFVFGRG